MSLMTYKSIAISRLWNARKLCLSISFGPDFQMRTYSGIFVIGAETKRIIACDTVANDHPTHRIRSTCPGTIIYNLLFLPYDVY